jgi:hypothetical protein
VFTEFFLPSKGVKKNMGGMRIILVVLVMFVGKLLSKIILLGNDFCKLVLEVTIKKR